MKKSLGFASVALLAAACAYGPIALAADTVDHVSLNGKTYDLAPGMQVIGADHMLYKTEGMIVDGKIALQQVSVADWNADKAAGADKAAPVTKPVDFIAEVEMKDCADFCEGNRIFHSGDANKAKVDKAFSGGTLTAWKNGMLVMTKSTEVVREDSFLHRMRGVANEGGAGAPR